jgi:hypothetical protein
LKIYCESSTLPENIRGADAKSQRELNAVRELQVLGIGAMFGSRIVYYEVMKTKDESRRNQLLVEQAACKQIPKDERPLGSQIVTDHGGFVDSPLVSDVQNEDIRAKLITRA